MNLSDAQRLGDVELRRTLKVAEINKDPLLWGQALWKIRGDDAQSYSVAKFPFLVEISQQKADLVTIMSSAGTGKTEFLLTYTLANADWGQRMIYCFETDGKAADLVIERVNPNIKNSPYLSERCHEADNVGFKQLAPGFVYFMGLGTDSATTSYHGDKLILDELDKMSPARVSLMKKRLTSAGHPQIIQASNPTFPEIGIDAEYRRGDQRRWHVPCLKCKLALPLSFHTHYDKAKNRFKCPECREDFDRLGAGFWKAMNPKGDHPSYHITGMMNPSFNAKKVAEEIEDPKASTREAAYRMDLGEAYETAESGLSASDLKASVSKVAVTKRAPGGFLTCDLGSLFDIQIYQHPDEDGLAVCTWAGHVKGFTELYQLVDESEVGGGVIDFQPELNGAEDFCKKQRIKGRSFYRAAYTIDAQDGPKFTLASKEANLVDVNRTRMADEFVAMLREGRKGEPRFRYAEAIARDEEGRWFKHMRSPKREQVPGKGGIPVTRWTHDDNRPDHQFHCGIYAAVAYGLKKRTAAAAAARFKYLARSGEKLGILGRAVQRLGF